MQQLTIALSKGRILKETLPLLSAIGIKPLEDVNKSRKLALVTNHRNIKLIILRATDVPTYVAHGAVDMGITGKDVLMESGNSCIYELLDLKIALCRLMTAAKVGVTLSSSYLRVASKFTYVAKQFYAERGIQVDVIKLYGSVELAPLIGLADTIVDIVDTGSTLRANSLQPLEEIAPISARLVVGQTAMKMKYKLIKSVVQQLKAAIESI